MGETVSDRIETLQVDAADLTFSVRAAGPVDGEAVVVLHGFPDHAASFDETVTWLAEHGFRAFAPALRGYEPSSQPADGDYSIARLASDVVDQLDVLGIDRAHVVGHDWGAVITYALAALYPERFMSATAMAVPPLARITEALPKVPRQLRLSWYMTFFQIRFVADRSLSAFGWRLMRRLWRKWSPGYRLDRDAWHALRATFERPGVRRASLAYYRRNATPLRLLGIRRDEAMSATETDVPLLILHGADDGCMDPAMFDHAVLADDHRAGVRVERLDGVGHFLHLEAPDRVHGLIHDHLTANPT